MVSLYNGFCYICGKQTFAGQDHWDAVKKRGFHSACQEREDDNPDEGQIELADRLKFKHYERETR